MSSQSASIWNNLLSFKTEKHRRLRAELEEEKSPRVSVYYKFCATNRLNIGVRVFFKEVSPECRFILFYSGVSLCNALPQNIKLSQSLAQFKTLMRKDY